MNCPRCGKTTVFGAAFCGECGMRLPQQSGNSMQDLIKRGEREADMAAKAAGDGLQSIIDDITKLIKK